MLSPIFAEITDTCMRKNCQLNIINSVFGVLCFYLFFVEWQWKRSLSNIKTVLNWISKHLEVCQKQFICISFRLLLGMQSRTLFYVWFIQIGSSNQNFMKESFIFLSHP